MRFECRVKTLASIQASPMRGEFTHSRYLFLKDKGGFELNTVVFDQKEEEEIMASKNMFECRVKTVASI